VLELFRRVCIEASIVNGPRVFRLLRQKLSYKYSILERPDVAILFDWQKLQISAVGQMADSVSNDAPLARHILPHVLLFLLLGVQVDKVLDLHDRLPGLGQMAILGRNLLAAVVAVPAHLQLVGLIQEEQEKLLKRAPAILFAIDILIGHRLTTKELGLDGPFGWNTRGRVDAFVGSHVPKQHFVCVIHSLDKTGNTLAHSKLVPSDVLAGCLPRSQLTCMMIHVRADRDEAPAHICQCIGIYVFDISVRVSKNSKAVRPGEILIPLFVQTHMILEVCYKIVEILGVHIHYIRMVELHSDFVILFRSCAIDRVDTLHL